ncbi:hypothetical protein [Flavobacterium degerlachei]|jgi:hypothetical protein|uniref:Uncharacterized protein n=1 Tax=Flavobacterium degerlachei TaxID=229203 RepID=A0A1H2WPZ8_9FLAO|nr:hypothetical protein [Flavobacterium degerlachei]SDW82743.1 hypothetical protein SAMN05444338_10526 [Flavobacterium degerlachei]
MSSEVKSGQEILDNFFEVIESIEGVDFKISKMISELYKEGTLTEARIKNELQQLRIQEKDEAKAN